MNVPHNFKRVILLLARSAEAPSGSADHGYDLVAPLTADGHIDMEAWRAHRDLCRVRRFWRGEDDEIGRLVHRPGGPHGSEWTFDYDPGTDTDDDTGYRLGEHVFQVGNYVSVRDHTGTTHTFSVASVENAE